MATPELLMTSKRSALAWRNCAVSARGQMRRERTVGRFSRRVETTVIYWPLAFIKGIGRSQRNCFQIRSLVFRKASWAGSSNEPVSGPRIDEPTRWHARCTAQLDPTYRCQAWR